MVISLKRLSNVLKPFIYEFLQGSIDNHHQISHRYNSRILMKYNTFLLPFL